MESIVSAFGMGFNQDSGGFKNYLVSEREFDPTKKRSRSLKLEKSDQQQRKLDVEKEWVGGKTKLQQKVFAADLAPKFDPTKLSRSDKNNLALLA